MIRLCAFADEAGSSLQAQIDALHRNGIGLLEIRTVDSVNIGDMTLERAEEVAAILKENNLKVWSLGSPMGKVSLDEEFKFEEYLPKVEHMCKLANIFGADKIRMFSFFDAYEKKEQVFAYLKQMVEVANKYGVKLCHENEKKVYIVMNKPKGFVTTLDDPHADKSVMDLVKNACTERIYPVGRLDKNSVGVLLLTNDGDLAKKLTHPTYEKKKIYQVSLDKRLERGDMERLIMGITLEDGEIAADDICYVEDPKMKNAVGIEIHSRRNRIVRRMIEHVGYRVGKLDRVYFAGLTKQKLKRGEWRFLTDKEVGLLKSGNYE